MRFGQKVAVVVVEPAAVELVRMNSAAKILTAGAEVESTRTNLAAAVAKREATEDPEYRAATMRWCRAMDL